MHSRSLHQPRIVVLLGTPFHDITMAETLDWIEQRIQQRTPSYLVTANLDFATQAASDTELQRILVEAELVLCDGTPLVWISRLHGKPLRERVAGSDLVPRLAQRMASSGRRLYLLGGDPESLEKATANLRNNAPGLIIAGAYSPPFAKLHEMNHEEITRRIRSTKPDVLLVAFGCPKQEKWIYAHYRDLDVPVCIGVGATIDFMAGKVRRAPAWIGMLGLEWVYRLAQEPGRLLGRYWKNILFLFSQMLRERRAFYRPTPYQSTAFISPENQQTENIEIIQWKGALLAGTTESLVQPTFGKPFIIDLSNVSRIDSRGLGHLLQIIRKAWVKGVPGCYASPSPEVVTILSITRLSRIVPCAPGIKEAREMISRDPAGGILRPLIDAEEKSMLVVMPHQIISENAAQFALCLASNWEKNPDLTILRLDFGPTDFIDSSGLGFLLRIHRVVTARNEARFELLHLRDNVLNVIQVAKLETLLGITR